MVYNKEIHNCLESYLSSCPRWYDEVDLDDVFIPYIETINHLVFLTFLRLATYKESKMDHITPEYWADLLYEHFIFDMCKILDLCSLYNSTKHELLGKMVSNIFNHQPKYYEDLEHIVDSLKSVIENVELTLGVAEHIRPISLDALRHQPTLDELSNTTQYLLDTFYSIFALLKIFPKACANIHKSNFELRLALCYEKIIPTLTEQITEFAQFSKNVLWTDKVLQKLKLLRSLSLSTFRIVIENVCLCPQKDNTSEAMEIFVQLMSNIVGERKFIVDYNGLYPVSKDLVVFERHNVDLTTIKFVEEAVETVVKEMGGYNDHESQENGDLGDPKPPADAMNGYIDTKDSKAIDIELVSMISSVQDLFPDLGGGFIEQCLKYFNNSTEDLINCLLEDNLPPNLRVLDRRLAMSSTPVTPEPNDVNDSTPENTDKSSVLVGRANIYDNDEFDLLAVSKTAVDLSKVHIGKRSMNENQVQDENFSTKMKEIVKKYDERAGTSIYEDELLYEPELAGGNDYDDEYDDTYDDHIAPPSNPTEEVGKNSRYPTIHGKGSLNKRFTEDAGDSDHNESSGQSRDSSSRERFSKDSRWGTNNHDGQNQNGNNLSFKAFCENPEIIRERAMQKRLDRDRLRFGGNIRRNNPPPQPTQSGSSEQNGEYPKRYAANKNSGKSWRQENDEDSGRGSHGGKMKQDSSTHGKAQDKNYKHKMVHKNDFKRRGADNKYRNNL